MCCFVCNFQTCRHGNFWLSFKVQGEMPIVPMSSRNLSETHKWCWEEKCVFVVISDSKLKLKREYFSQLVISHTAITTYHKSVQLRLFVDLKFAFVRKALLACGATYRLRMSGDAVVYVEQRFFLERFVTFDAFEGALHDFWMFSLKVTLHISLRFELLTTIAVETYVLERCLHHKIAKCTSLCNAHWSHIVR